MRCFNRQFLSQIVAPSKSVSSLPNTVSAAVVGTTTTTLATKPLAVTASPYHQVTSSPSSLSSSSVVLLPQTTASTSASASNIITASMTTMTTVNTTAYRFRGKDGGARRLGFDEMASRRTRTSKDEKEDLFKKQEEIEQYVTTEFPQEVDDCFDAHIGKAKSLKMRLLDPVGAIEKLKVVVPPHPARPIPQLGSILKINSTTIHVIPHKTESTGSIATALTRAFPEFRSQKSDGGGGNNLRVECLIDPTTREKRVACADSAKNHQRDFGKELIKMRKKAINRIEGSGIKDMNLIRQRKEEVDAYVKDQSELRDMEFDEFIESIFTDDSAFVTDDEAAGDGDGDGGSSSSSVSSNAASSAENGDAKK